MRVGQRGAGHGLVGWAGVGGVQDRGPGWGSAMAAQFPLPPSLPALPPLPAGSLPLVPRRLVRSHCQSPPRRHSAALCRDLSLPQRSLSTFPPSMQTPKRSSQLLSTNCFFPGAGAHGFILLSGRESTTGSVTGFLNLPGPLYNGNNHGCSATQWG